MNFRKLWILLPVLALLFVSCSKDDDDSNNNNSNPNNDGNGTVSSNESGTIRDANGAQINVPVGAVPLRDDGTAGTMMFSIERNEDIDVVPPAGETAASAAFQFGPEGFIFARPVEISVPVDNPEASGQFHLWRINPTTLQPEYFGCDYDATTHTVRAQTYSFSTWFVTNSPVGENADGCLSVDNATGRWLSVCVTSVQLDFPEQAHLVPELGQGVLYAPQGTTGWTSHGNWYLPQGVYNLCLSYEEPAGSGEYVHEFRTGINVTTPWNINNPVCTELSVSAFTETQSGRCECIPEATTSVGTGDIQVTLVWHSVESLDLDLWVMDPDSEWCYFGDGQAPDVTTSGGQLDRDNLCGNYVNGRPENIYWTQTPPSGEYIVGVAWYSDCGNSMTQMPVSVRTVVRDVTRTYTDTITPELGSMVPKEICRFQIQGSEVQFLPPRDGVQYTNLPAAAAKD